MRFRYPFGLRRTARGAGCKLRCGAAGSARTIPGRRLWRGFTLLQTLVAIALLAIAVAIAVRVVAGHMASEKWDAGKVGVARLDQDVQAYALDNGSPPKVLAGLLEQPVDAPSWNGPYAQRAALTDPFGHAYGYRNPGQHGRYDIIFYGRDGKAGGEGVDRDYGNWQ